MVNPLSILMELMGGSTRGLDPSQLQAFLKGNQKNQWLDIGPYKAYLRKGERLLPRGDWTRIRDLGKFKTLELANVERQGGTIKNLPEDQRPPKGKFSELMDLLENSAAEQGYDAVYTEQILNEFLPQVLAKRGYFDDQMHRMMNPTTPSMYKYINRKI